MIIEIALGIVLAVIILATWPFLLALLAIAVLAFLFTQPWFLEDAKSFAVAMSFYAVGIGLGVVILRARDRWQERRHSANEKSRTAERREGEPSANTEPARSDHTE